MNKTEIIVDNFAGGGGASLGLEWALGRPIDLAINHDSVALELHRLNHPETEHLCKDLFDVDPLKATRGRPVGLAWFSPDCKHFSKAKGGRPVEKKIRALAWVVIRWAARVRPRIIILENVEEFQTWGPLTGDGRPCKQRKGQTFRQWVGHLEKLGYVVQWRELVACDFGVPTSRKRFFLVARCDGQPIVWPEPTHGPGLLPYRTAAECIDWSLPCPSIFERKRPLAENTLKRIAEGIRRYVLQCPEPFIVRYHGPKREGDFRGSSIHDPLGTQTTENRFGLVAPSIVKCNHEGGFRGQSVKEPLRTVMASSRGHHALCAAFLAKHYGGVVGQDLDKPIGAVTSKDHHSLVAAHLTKFYGTNVGSDLREPIPTVTANGQHIGEVRAFLLKYYGTGVGQRCGEPLHTVTTKDRLGLVTVEGDEYQIVDIGLRMLQPRELARAHGFPEEYKLRGTKTVQVRLIGNSVPPAWAYALAKENYSEIGAMPAAVGASA